MMNFQEIFLAAIEIDDLQQRAAYVAQACGEDQALHRKVNALLAAHEKSGEFLDVPALQQLADGKSPDLNADQKQKLQEEINLSFLKPSSKPGSQGRLLHYEVLEILGRGGCGIVLKAFDEKLHRVVAIKMMTPELAATSPARKRFLREARTTAAIRHDNVVSIYAVEEKPLPFLVMEFIDGQTLQDKINETGPLDILDVLSIGRQIALGLEAAHSQGLIHRDIKPANILMENGTGRPKITDFGLARSADDASLTRSGAISGTPLYMSPEQAQGFEIDHRSDLFSLGSVLYVMCSGRPPFRAATAVAVLKRVVEEQPRPIWEIIPETPEWLVAVIARLHAKEPTDRLSSAHEVAKLLERSVAEELPQVGQAVGVTALNRFKSAVKVTQSPWRGWRIAGLAAVILVLAVITRWSFTGSGYHQGTLTDAALRQDMIEPLNNKEVEAETQHDAQSVAIIPDPIIGKWTVENANTKVTYQTEFHANGQVTTTVPPGLLLDQQRNGNPVPEKMSFTGRWKHEGMGNYRLTREDGIPIFHLTLHGDEFQVQGGHIHGKRQKSNTPSASHVASNPDRKAAEYVTSIQGKVFLRGIRDSFTRTADLPDSPFEFVAFDLLENRHVNDIGMANFAGTTHLEKIKLDAAPHVTDEGLAFLRENRNLGLLGLSYNQKITRKGLEHFRHCSKLRNLWLMGTKVTDDDLEVFKDLKTLTLLGIQYTSIGDAGLAHFRKNKDLYQLELAGTQVSDTGLATIAEFTKIGSLNLEGTKMSDDGLNHLKHLTGMIYLNLSRTQVTDAGCEYLLAYKNLHSLNLANTAITNDGLGVIGKLDSLHQLNLEGTGIDDQGLAHLRRLPYLDEINVKGTKITTTGMEDFKQSHPKCKITWDGGVIKPSNP